MIWFEAGVVVGIGVGVYGLLWFQRVLDRQLGE